MNNLHTSPLSSCKNLPPYFFHGAFAPSFMWRRRPCLKETGDHVQPASLRGTYQTGCQQCRPMPTKSATGDPRCSSGRRYRFPLTPVAQSSHQSNRIVVCHSQDLQAECLSQFVKFLRVTAQQRREIHLRGLQLPVWLPGCSSTARAQ